MANLLLDPLNWFDGDEVSPPSSWNGSSYAVSTGPETLGFLGLGYNGGPPASGDVIAGTVTQVNDGDGIDPAGPIFLVLVNTAGDVVLDSVEVPLATPIEFSFDATAPGMSALRASASAESTGPAGWYGLELTLTPADSPPPVDNACEEYGRVTRAYVSGYQRDRVHRSRLVRGEKRCLFANFNGAIPASRVIVSATWRCDQNQAVFMANARITDAGRCAAVDITAQIGAGGRVKCQVTLDNGEVYNQLFYVRVFTSPWFFGESYSFAQGPTELTATA